MNDRISSLLDATPDAPDAISENELAKLLGVTPRNVRTLASDGIIQRTGPARYARGEAVRAYCEHLREKATRKTKTARAELDAEQIRLKRAQAEKAEIQAAELRGEMLPAGAVEASWASTLRDLRAAMLAIPSRVQQHLPHLTAHDTAAIDREIRDALTEAAGGDSDDRP